mgnify:FL=1
MAARTLRNKLKYRHLSAATKHKTMKSYLRFLSRNKLYTTIMAVGLSVALTFVTLIGTYVWQQFNTAHNIRDYDRIYSLGYDTGEFSRVGLYLGAADKIRDNIPEIELSGSYLDMPLQDIVCDGINIQAKPICADKGFFDIFGIEFLNGSCNVLDDKSNIIVSESFANANGGPVEVIGKKVILRNKEFFVAAVLKEQKKSLFKDYDIVINPDSDINSRLKRFKFYSTTIPFLKLREDVDIETIKPKLEEEMKKIAEEGEFLKSPDCIIVNCKELFFSKYGYMWLNKSDLKSLKVMLFVVILLFASAIINFVNLSTALYTKRMKETASRMIIGAGRKKLFYRYLFESAGISLICGIIAIVTAIVLEGYINNLVRSDIPIEVSHSPGAILIYAVAAILVGVVSGLIPAAIGISVHPMYVIKGDIKRDNKRVFSKAFILLQNTISTVLIALAITMQSQMNHMISKPVGADTGDLYYLYVNDIDRREPLENALKKLPFVCEVGVSEGFPGQATETNTFDREGNEIKIGMILCDSTAFRLYNFKRASANNHPTVNSIWMPQQTYSTLVSQAGFIEKHPLFAGEEKITFGGIVEDYAVLDALRDSEGYLTYIQIQDAKNFSPWMSNGAGLLIKTTGEHGDNKKKIDEEYRKYVESVEGRYTEPAYSGYIKDLLSKKLQTVDNQTKIMDLFMLISIILSFMGLLAMSTYYSSESTSDIAIRKIYGSSARSETLVSTWRYMRIVLVSCIIALPIAIYACGRYLEEFVYRIDNKWWVYALAMAISVIISISAVFVQVSRAARTNPAEALKKE